MGGGVDGGYGLYTNQGCTYSPRCQDNRMSYVNKVMIYT